MRSCALHLVWDRGHGQQRCGLCSGMEEQDQIEKIQDVQIMCAICKKHYHDVHPLARICKRCFGDRA